MRCTVVAAAAASAPRPHTQLPRGTGVLDTPTGDGESLTWEEGFRSDERRHPDASCPGRLGATGAESQCELYRLSRENSRTHGAFFSQVISDCVLEQALTLEYSNLTALAKRVFTI
jgi:hypothetical protein